MLSPIANSPKPHEKKSCDKRLSSKTTYAALESGNGSIDGGGDHADEDDEQDAAKPTCAARNNVQKSAFTKRIYSHLERILPTDMGSAILQDLAIIRPSFTCTVGIHAETP